MYRMLDTLQY